MLTGVKHLASRIRKGRYLIELASPGQDEALCRQWVLGHRGDAALSRLAPRLLPPLLGHVALLLPAPPLPLLVDVAGNRPMSIVATDDVSFADVQQDVDADADADADRQKVAGRRRLQTSR